MQRIRKVPVISYDGGGGGGEECFIDSILYWSAISKKIIFFTQAQLSLEKFRPTL